MNVDANKTNVFKNPHNLKSKIKNFTLFEHTKKGNRRLV